MLHLRVLLIRVRKLLRLRVPLVLASLDLRKLRGLQGLVPVVTRECLVNGCYLNHSYSISR